MEENQENTGSYTVENIVLMDLSFERKKTIDLNEKAIDNKIGITTEIGENIEENKFIVSVLLTVHSMLNDDQLFYIKTKMSGIFLKNGNPKLPEEIFKKINAPAIIYPFIREQVATICVKSGLGNIFLPPVNFVERNK